MNMSDDDDKKEIRKRFLAIDRDFEQRKKETAQVYFDAPKRVELVKVVAKEDIRKIRKKL